MPAKFRKREKDAADRSSGGSEDDRAPKRAKKEAGPVTPLDPSLPTNITLPQRIELPAKPEGSTRIACWNVAGLQAANKKGMRLYVEAEDPDILVLTETKSDEKRTDEAAYLWLKQRFSHRTWGVDQQKGYSGTAILSKIKPISVVKGLPTLPDLHTESRIVTYEFEKTYIVGTYVPNAGQKLKNMAGKEQWNEAFEEYLRQLDAKKPVIWCGDINVAPTEKDLRNPKTNWNKTAGYTESECSAFKRQLQPAADSGHKPLIDVWRQMHPDTVGHYSYVSFRKDCRTKGIGWRLDMFILSERLVSRALSCEIRHEIFGPSDHLPVTLDLQGEL